MRVDLPAPFSPMSVWTSPGSSRKLTSSRAFTPGKVMDALRTSTIAIGSIMAAAFLRYCGELVVMETSTSGGRRNGNPRSHQFSSSRRGRGSEALALFDRGLSGLGRVEGLTLDDDGLLDVVAGEGVVDSL